MAETQLTEQQERAWRKFIGKRRLAHVERALADPALISLRQELVKVDLRIAELEEKARKGGTRLQWREVALKATEIKLAALEAAPDAARLSFMAGALADLAHLSLGDEAVWDDIERLLELRRKLSDTERKYEELTKVLIPATQVARLFDDLYVSISAVIPDNALRLALLYDIRVRLNADAKNHPGQRVPIDLPPSYLLAQPPAEGELVDDDATAVEPETEPDGAQADAPAPAVAH